MKSIALAVVFCATCAPAMAEISVDFIEGAPKDRFVITGAACSTGPVHLTIDLRPSAGALIFDVTGEGAGVEVFQPFELISGGTLVTRAPTVLDGDQMLTLEFAGLGPDATVAFTIDLDDTVQDRAITVAGSELAGAKVLLQSERISTEGTFDATSKVVLPWDDCAS